MKSNERAVLLDDLNVIKNNLNEILAAYELLQARCDKYETALSDIKRHNSSESAAWKLDRVKNIANEALSAGDGGPVKTTDDKPKVCGNCGRPGYNYIGNQYYMCDDCMETPENL